MAPNDRPPTELDRRFMAAAIELGRRNNGLARPNPSVGAIVVRKEAHGFEVISRAVTAPGGRPHAEAQALALAGARAKGATLYVTLEPCSHHGVTPPCCEAIARAGIAHVVAALDDPDPRVAGKGYDYLRRQGIAVTTGVLQREAALLHAGHVSRVTRDRPHVNLKLAASADGFIGREGEGQIAITGPRAKAFALGLRVEHDAIMVGIGTVLADDPALTNRLAGCERRNPVRVILDADARTPLTAKVVAAASSSPTWLFAAPDAPEDRMKALAHKGVLIEVAERDASGRLDLQDVLFQLGRLGITSVISEGGARVARALLEADLVDEVNLVRSDLVLGARGVPALAGLPIASLAQDERFTLIERRRLGEDRLMRLFRRSALPKG
ncbi:bifunctional diaminohydroxyphosphoribosylaminopyrimidine deaminase/5-amino-6-(5-phosphoribosylamino)uracil reductase RibD [Oryzibacter oryziterrae]|uniref:bifunctional diaminohydroxyphosphoribosylaminopyrimidine deaminase/5-amino-6-(5-phosphoribosylamino)uracil reductase RibD n=1 Tax=Oryzibacter oryziterrae TaxID=2766474 RepID=UPI001F0091EB|nr:bifunctional diaminohydroxyphosphoribosylaminopyrimidine deaminase/5-amino-6-(5-phosphoribosylamino)uracil reductase RibD [Oryzibacter oryziterrae]